MPPPWARDDTFKQAVLESMARIEGLLAQQNALLSKLTLQEEQTMATIADLQTEVGQNTSVTESAVALLNGLSQQLKDALAANDPAAIQAVVDQLDANTASLAEAVSQNTEPPSDGLGNPAEQPEEPAPGEGAPVEGEGEPTPQ